MKAYVLHGINDLCMEEVQKPHIKRDEVLIEVKAAGICGSDIPRIYQTGTYSYPLIPGHEFSGIVTELGADVEQSWMGKRVGVFPLIPCMECAPCQKTQYELCRNYSYHGSRTDGAFAEYIAVSKKNLIALQDSVSYEAAAMLEPMAVAVHALRSMEPKPEETVVVCGLGTIGIMTVMFLKEIGIRNLYVIGNKTFQKELVLSLGIEENHFFDSQNSSQRIMEVTNGLGADVFFECVGKNETITCALNNTAPGGRIQMIGNPSSDMLLEKNTYWRILRNEITIKGSWNSSFTHHSEDDWHYVLERLENGRIQPEEFLTHKVSFLELENGLKMMRDKTENYVKVMMTR